MSHASGAVIVEFLKYGGYPEMQWQRAARNVNASRFKEVLAYSFHLVNARRCTAFVHVCSALVTLHSNDACVLFFHVSAHFHLFSLMMVSTNPCFAEMRAHLLLTVPLRRAQACGISDCSARTSRHVLYSACGPKCDLCHDVCDAAGNSVSVHRSLC